MDKYDRMTRYVCMLVLAVGVGLLPGTGPASADPSKHYYDSYDRREYRDDRHYRDYRYSPRERNHHEYRFQHQSPNFSYRGRVRVARPDQVRWYRNIVVRRPYGHWYRGYAHYYRDYARNPGFPE